MKKGAFDRRPTRPTPELKKLMSSTAPPALSADTSKGAPIKPALSLRIFMTVLGASLGLGVLAVLWFLVWLTQQGYGMHMVAAVLLIGGGYVGWQSTPKHVKRWGSKGGPRK